MRATLILLCGLISCGVPTSTDVPITNIDTTAVTQTIDIPDNADSVVIVFSNNLVTINSASYKSSQSNTDLKNLYIEQNDEGICLIKVNGLITYQTEYPNKTYEVENKVIVVKEGNTLKQIARDNNTTVEEIVRKDNLKNKVIYINQRLKL